MGEVRPAHPGARARCKNKRPEQVILTIEYWLLCLPVDFTILRQSFSNEPTCAVETCSPASDWPLHPMWAAFVLPLPYPNSILIYFLLFSIDRRQTVENAHWP